MLSLRMRLLVAFIFLIVFWGISAPTWAQSFEIKGPEIKGPEIHNLCGPECKKKEEEEAARKPKPFRFKMDDEDEENVSETSDSPKKEQDSERKPAGQFRDM